jgi:hypothetical protein
MNRTINKWITFNFAAGFISLFFYLQDSLLESSIFTPPLLSATGTLIIIAN